MIMKAKEYDYLVRHLGGYDSGFYTHKEFIRNIKKDVKEHLTNRRLRKEAFEVLYRDALLNLYDCLDHIEKQEFKFKFGEL